MNHKSFILMRRLRKVFFSKIKDYVQYIYRVYRNLLISIL